MKVGIFSHDKNGSREAAAALGATLGAAGASVRLFSDPQQIGEVDRLIVLGGDGAMLRAAKQAALHAIPLFGVNYGTIGFLTEFERGEEDKAVALVLDEHCACEERSMLEAQVGGRTFHCLNEIAFMRPIAPGAEDGVIRIGVEVDGCPAGGYSADGLILSTPTGSTAYSLSAGGSILAPGCGAFMLTPVNAFSLRSRPIVLSDASALSFTVRDVTIVHGDGEFLGQLDPGDEVSVKRSSRRATFLVQKKLDLFRRLAEKIDRS